MYLFFYFLYQKPWPRPPPSCYFCPKITILCLWNQQNHQKTATRQIGSWQFSKNCQLAIFPNHHLWKIWKIGIFVQNALKQPLLPKNCHLAGSRIPTRHLRPNKAIQFSKNCQLTIFPNHHLLKTWKNAIFVQKMLFNAHKTAKIAQNRNLAGNRIPTCRLSQNKAIPTKIRISEGIYYITCW